MRDLLTVVFKRKWLIFLFATSVLIVVGFATFVAPPVYEVESTLLVTKARAEVPIAAQDSPQFIIREVSQEDLNTEIEILKSRQLLS